MTVLDLPPALAFTEATVGRAALEAGLRARRFSRAVIRPAALTVDARAARDATYFPWGLVRAGAREGWLGAGLPGFLGGEGLDITAMSVVMEELCAGDAGVGNIFGAHGLGMLPILLSLDLDLATRVLGHVGRAARTADPLLCAFAITEPGGGSDVEEGAGLATGDVRTTARRAPGGYRLSGRKVFISNGNVAHYVVVFGALDRADPRASWTGFVVERTAPGFACPRVEHKLGQRACPAAELVLDDVFVPGERRVGPEGGGWALTRRVLAVSRGPVGAIAVGIARDAFECAWTWVREARSRGIPGAGDAWIDDTLARMVVSIRSARAAYVEAARHCDAALLPGPVALGALGLVHGEPSGLGRLVANALAKQRAGDAGAEAAWAHQCILAATAKVAASDAAMEVATTALDIVPPTAGEVRARAEKAFRDAKLTQIYEGTNQINLRAIAHESWAPAPEPPRPTARLPQPGRAADGTSDAPPTPRAPLAPLD